MESSEKTPLIGKVKALEKTHFQPRCRFLIEPFMFLYVLSTDPLLPLNSQITFLKVAQWCGANVTTLGHKSYCIEGGDTLNGSSSVDLNMTFYVQRESAKWHMYFKLVETLPSIFTLLFMGAMMDKIGRKVMFILPCIGTVIAATALMIILHFDLPVYFLLLTKIEFLFGGTNAVVVGACGYIADTTPSKSRGLRMTIIDAMFLLGGALASLGTGYLIKSYGLFFPLPFIIGGKLICLLYAIFLVPETLLKSEDSKTSSFGIFNIFRGIKLLLGGTLKQRWKIALILLIFTLSEIFRGNNVLDLFQMNHPLCLGPVELGWVKFEIMGTKFIGLVVGGALNMCIPGIWLAFLGMVSSTMEYAFLGSVQNVTMMFIAPVLGTFSNLTMPMFKAMMSDILKPDELGSIYTLMSVIFKLCIFVSSFTVNAVYAATLAILPGFVFYVTALFHAVTLPLIGLYIFKTREERKPHDEGTGIMDNNSNESITKSSIQA